MIKITETEKEFLQSEGFDYPEYLHHTLGKSRKKTYYATEAYDLMKCLRAYRKKVLAK